MSQKIGLNHQLICTFKGYIHSSDFSKFWAKKKTRKSQGLLVTCTQVNSSNWQIIATLLSFNIYTVPGFCSTSLDSKSNKKTVAPLFARKLFIILSAIWHHNQSITSKLPFRHTFCLKKTPFGQYSTCRQRLKTEQFGLWTSFY